MSLESPRSVQLADQGGEAIERLQSFWARSGRILLAALGILILVGAGGYFMRRNQQNRESQAATKVAEATAYYWQGDYARSTELAKQVSTQFAGTRSGADALRLLGDNQFWNGEFKPAAESYRKYLQKSGSGLLADAARRSLAYALESDHQYAEAAKAYDELVGRFDRASSAEFLWASARCLRALGQGDQAIERLRRIEREFGETTYARSAMMTIAEIEASKG
ncbi:MAG: tetratricopeptide repeat protein [Candidatus Eisenbacteria bacterium]|uniref:Tetratricopeptide repeat protein n=1 Tax=Eiseniibacteriota bacterium TaxID=2212470 RepID=A0A849SBY7_UNCEI|nr:tetratricopeptide repeat protein [Candidatus Eisenbacteria bacterium]